jgi:hypothetical protein
MNSFFFHPDCTVGSGVPPGLPKGSRALTAGRESHPALKKYWIQFWSIIQWNLDKCKCFFRELLTIGRAFPIMKVSETKEEIQA